MCGVIGFVRFRRGRNLDEIREGEFNGASIWTQFNKEGGEDPIIFCEKRNADEVE